MAYLPLCAASNFSIYHPVPYCFIISKQVFPQFRYELLILPIFARFAETLYDPVQLLPVILFYRFFDPPPQLPVWKAAGCFFQPLLQMESIHQPFHIREILKSILYPLSSISVHIYILHYIQLIACPYVALYAFPQFLCAKFLIYKMHRFLRPISSLALFLYSLCYRN